MTQTSTRWLTCPSRATQSHVLLCHHQQQGCMGRAFVLSAVHTSSLVQTATTSSGSSFHWPDRSDAADIRQMQRRRRALAKAVWCWMDWICWGCLGHCIFLVKCPPARYFECPTSDVNKPATRCKCLFCNSKTVIQTKKSRKYKNVYSSQISTHLKCKIIRHILIKYSVDGNHTA